MAELDKRYDPSSSEERWYAWWEQEGFFRADPDRGGTPYTIVIPPPNITGFLHMGHALNNTLQDVLIRWKRMAGFNTLWLPGTDHASIATEAVVTRKLTSEGLDKREMGRDAFLERVWEWKEEYGDRIIMQLRRIGCSCDWTRTRFTMDEGLSHAVRTVFKRLYDEGLIYRGDYLVNWCPALRTVLSDDEVEHREIQGTLTYINYPLEDGSGHVMVATTRPETMLGDTAVAMNPEDERYQHLRGKFVILPLMNRRIPIIEDEFVRPEFGTGLVKVTPAHDPNDYDMGRRHNLPMINILNLDGTLNENAGPYAGLDRFEARKKVVRDLKALELIDKIDKYVHSVGHCYRSHDVVEPMLSKQWFVKMEPLVGEAIRVVEDGRVRFIPKNWENTYFHWLRNVRDWPISRQLWWGHRIPVWYCQDCGEIIVSAGDAPVECTKCHSQNLQQDNDVLDTWFSSALWPFSTLGWPDDAKDVNFYYPTSALLTAHEIIFFWVARMIIMGLKFRGDIPFRDVYIHPVVMDEQGRKMSKSLGNSIDPIGIIEEFGTDSMRLTLCAYAVAGRNINLSNKRIEGYRNFINKIWNAARLVLMNTEDLTGEELAKGLDESALQTEDRWILSAYERLVQETNRNLENYAFDQYIDRIYHFTWGKYCDWYLELVKERLYKKDNLTSRQNAQKILVTVLEGVLRLLHPAIPFVTEEIWQKIKEQFYVQTFSKKIGTKNSRLEEIAKNAGLKNEEMIIDLIRQGVENARAMEASLPESQIQERDILRMLAEEMHLEIIDLNEIEVSADLIEQVDPSTIVEYAVFPVRYNADTIWIAVMDPLDVQAIFDLKAILRKNVIACVAPEEDIRRAISRHYGVEAAAGKEDVPIRPLAAKSIMVAPWPAQADERRIDAELESNMELVQETITAARQIRGEHNISPGEKTDLIIACPETDRLLMLRRHSHYFMSLINLHGVDFREQADMPGFSGVGVVDDIQVIVPMSEERRAEERKRLEKALENARNVVERSRKKLENPDYVQRAPEKVVATEREKLQVAEKELAQIEEKLKGM